MNIEAQVTTIEKLNQPCDLTHYMVMKIISNDGSVKELVFRYSQGDYWAANCTGIVNNAETIAAHILPIISRDKRAVGVLAEVREIGTQNMVFKFSPYILKPEYLTGSPMLNNLQVNLLN